MKIILSLFLFVSLYSNGVEYARTLIIKHEGYKQHLYTDHLGHMTIGFGTNIANGLTRDEAILLLDFRLKRIENLLLKHNWYTKLDYTRKSIILDMSYNLGYSGILKFKNMIWCLDNNFYNAASNHMKKSLWYKQTGIRARDLAHLMQTN